MNHFKKILVSTFLLITILKVTAENSQSKNYMQNEPFGLNATQNLLNPLLAYDLDSDKEGISAVFGADFVASRTFNSDKLGSYAFWAADGSNEMTVGSWNGSADIYAGQFGLGNVTNTGSIKINPVFTQFGSNINLYLASNKEKRGFYCKINLPIGICYLNSNLTEPTVTVANNYVNTGIAQSSIITASIANSGTANQNSYAGGTNINTSMTQALAGGNSSTLWSSLTNGKIVTKTINSGTKVGDILCSLGLNILASETSHLSLGANCSIPCGNKPKGIYLLEPIFGNGGHLCFGGELNGHLRVWTDKKNDKKLLNVAFNSIMRYVHSVSQLRSFDLTVAGKGSKYMQVYNALASTPTEYLVNVSTLAAKSSFNIESSSSLDFNLIANNWVFDLGSEFYIRSKENLKLTGNFPTQYVIYPFLGHAVPFANDRQVYISNQLSINYVPQYTSNYNASNAQQITTINIGQYQLTNDSLDVEGAALPRVMSGKIFGAMTYLKQDSNYAPYFGLTGAVKFSCAGNNATDEFSVGIRAGFSV